MSHTFLWIVFIGPLAGFFAFLFYTSYRAQQLRVEVREIIRHPGVNAGDPTLSAGGVVFRIRNVFRFAWLLLFAVSSWTITLNEGTPLNRIDQIAVLIFTISALLVGAMPFVYEVVLSERGLRVGPFFPREIRFDEIKRLSMDEGKGGFSLLIETESGKNMSVNAGLIDFRGFVRLLSQKVSRQSPSEAASGQ